jgi:hypothetical protein
MLEIAGGELMANASGGGGSSTVGTLPIDSGEFVISARGGGQCCRVRTVDWLDISSGDIDTQVSGGSIGAASSSHGWLGRGSRPRVGARVANGGEVSGGQVAVRSGRSVTLQRRLTPSV